MRRKSFEAKRGAAGAATACTLLPPPPSVFLFRVCVLPGHGALSHLKVVENAWKERGRERERERERERRA
jgi:hypothetical protein